MDFMGNKHFLPLFRHNFDDRKSHDNPREKIKLKCWENYLSFQNSCELYIFNNNGDIVLRQGNSQKIRFLGIVGSKYLWRLVNTDQIICRDLLTGRIDRAIHEDDTRKYKFLQGLDGEIYLISLPMGFGSRTTIFSHIRFGPLIVE